MEMNYEEALFIVQMLSEDEKDRDTCRNCQEMEDEKWREFLRCLIHVLKWAIEEESNGDPGE